MVGPVWDDMSEYLLDPTCVENSLDFRQKIVGKVRRLGKKSEMFQETENSWRKMLEWCVWDIEGNRVEAPKPEAQT